MEAHPILRSLLTTATVASTTTTTAITGVWTLSSPPQKSVYRNIMTNLYNNIMFRFLFILLLGITAIWANHEASKGFSITVVNDAGKYVLSGKRFSIFFETNDKATRVILNASRFIENLLNPTQDFLHMKKQISSVTLRLAATNLEDDVMVSLQKPHEYLISLSPSLMESSEYNDAIVVAVLKGMARVWLYDGKGETPVALLNGVVEYICNLAGFTVTEMVESVWPEDNEICWKYEDPRMVAGFLRYCDRMIQARGGGGGGGGQVIRRLNDRMRESWRDDMIDDLGMPAQHACASYTMMMRDHHLSSSI